MGPSGSSLGYHRPSGNQATSSDVSNNICTIYQHIVGYFYKVKLRSMVFFSGYSLLHKKLLGTVE